MIGIITLYDCHNHHDDDDDDNDNVGCGYREKMRKIGASALKVAILMVFN